MTPEELYKQLDILYPARLLQADGWRDIAIPFVAKDIVSEIAGNFYGLVGHIAKRYQGGHTLTYDDLCQEGKFGLVVGIWKYDPQKGKLSSFVGKWIGAAIQRAIENTGYTIRFPVGLHQAARKADGPERELRDHLVFNDYLDLQMTTHTDYTKFEVLELLDGLTAREARVIICHFGLFGDRPMSAPQIGKKMGITKQRVNQIKSDALRKLKALIDP